MQRVVTKSMSLLPAKPLIAEEGAPSILGLKTLDTSAMQSADLWGATQSGRADKGNASWTNADDLTALCAPVGVAMVAL